MKNAELDEHSTKTELLACFLYEKDQHINPFLFLPFVDLTDEDQNAYIVRAELLLPAYENNVDLILEFNSWVIDNVGK